MTIKERFAADYGLTHGQVENLCVRAEAACKAQTNVVDDRTGKVADQKIAWFEETATKYGFEGVDWPGFYPTVTKNGKRFINLPLDD